MGERIEKLSAGKRTASRRQENDLNSHEMVHDLVVDLSLNSLNITRQDRSARVLLWIDTFFCFFFFLFVCVNKHKLGTILYLESVLISQAIADYSMLSFFPSAGISQADSPRWASISYGLVLVP